MKNVIVKPDSLKYLFDEVHKVVYNLTNCSELERITTQDIEKETRLSTKHVIGALKMLMNQQLIDYPGCNVISITHKGIDVAEAKFSNPTIEKRKKDRLKFLKVLHDLHITLQSDSIEIEKVGSEAGFEKDYSHRLAEFLEDSGYIKNASIYSGVVLKTITKSGLEKLGL